MWISVAQCECSSCGARKNVRELPKKYYIFLLNPTILKLPFTK
jgi:hypothetical protein